MKIRDLPKHQLETKLRGGGLCFQTGPFVFHLRTTATELAGDFQHLYGQYTLADELSLADYHVRLVPPRGLRRWIRPQIEFVLDGFSTFHPFPRRLALALLEWGLNYCVFTQAHQYLIFHSAVVERSGRAMLLAAPPGSGKSTLCAAMVHRGWRLFSDEIGLLGREDGRLTPNPRPVNLKGASIRLIQEFAPKAQFGPVLPYTRKGTVSHVRAPDESVQRAGETATSAWVIFPQYRAGAAIQLRRLKKSRALLRLAHSAFNYNLLGTEGFRMLADLIDRCDCYDLVHNDLDKTLSLLNALLD